MTKQDFEALAQLIKLQRCCKGMGPDICVTCSNGGYTPMVLDEVARDMAQYMTRYPAFDQAKFLAAAGVS